MEAAAAAVVGMRQRQREWRQHGRAEAAVVAALGAPGAACSSHFGPAPGVAGAAAGKSLKSPRQPSRLRAAGGPGAAAAAPAQASEQQQQQQQGTGGHAGPVSLALLHCLRPEARAALLLSLPAAQRQQLLAAMGDTERAGMVVLLDESTRLQVGTACVAVMVPPVQLNCTAAALLKESVWVSTPPPPENKRARVLLEFLFRLPGCAALF